MAENDIWITKDGRRIKMHNLNNEHLKRAINYFKPNKNLKKNKKRWKLLMTEQKRRDDLIPDNSIESRFDILDLMIE